MLNSYNLQNIGEIMVRELTVRVTDETIIKVVLKISGVFKHPIFSPICFNCFRRPTNISFGQHLVFGDCRGTSCTSMNNYSVERYRERSDGSYYAVIDVEITNWFNLSSELKTMIIDHDEEYDRLIMAIEASRDDFKWDS